jgi:hypothetical protein
MKLEETVKQLEANRRMRSSEEVVAFEKALEYISTLNKLNDLELLERLHLVFDDDTEHHEIMFGLVHLLENADVDMQIIALVKALPRLKALAPEWAKILHFRLLNDAVSRESYREVLKTEVEPSHIIAARELLTEIASHEPEPLSTYARSIL